MAYEDTYDALSRPASGALATTRVGVVINSSDQLAAATAGARIDGILLFAVGAAGDEASFIPINEEGGFLVRAGGTCTAGSDAMVTTGGKFIDAVNGNEAVGRFETGTTTDGDLVRMTLFARAQGGRTKSAQVSLTGAAIHGGVQAWANPEIGTIVITQLLLDITTAATGAATLSSGTTAVSATTASANLIDTLDVNAAANVAVVGSPSGTNGKTGQRLATGKWVTFKEQSGDVTGLVVNAIIKYHLA